MFADNLEILITSLMILLSSITITSFFTHNSKNLRFEEWWIYCEPVLRNEKGKNKLYIESTTVHLALYFIWPNNLSIAGFMTFMSGCALQLLIRLSGIPDNHKTCRILQLWSNYRFEHSKNFIALPRFVLLRHRILVFKFLSLIFGLGFRRKAFAFLKSEVPNYYVKLLQSYKAHRLRHL